MLLRKFWKIILELLVYEEVFMEMKPGCRRNFFMKKTFLKTSFVGLIGRGDILLNSSLNLQLLNYVLQSLFPL